MRHNGRNIYNNKITEHLVNMNSSQCMVEIVARRHAEIRKEIEDSEEFKTKKTAREIAQGFDVIKKNIIYDLRETIKQTTQSVLQLIKQDLGVCEKARKKNGYIQENITDEQINEIINKYLPILKELRRLSNNDEINSTNVKFLTSYEFLFVELILLDSRFAIYAPLASLNRSGVSEKLDFVAQHQEKINNLKADLKENENLDYISKTEIVEPKTKDKRDIKIQSMVDLLGESELKSKLELVKATEDLSSNVYKFIIKELNLQTIDEKNVKFVDIKNAFAICSSAINALKLSSARDDLHGVSGWEELDPYTELFNKLMKINIKFAFFAPKKSLNRLNIDFNRLSDKEKNVMKKVLIDNGLLDNDEYFENYKVVLNLEKTQEQSI